MAVKLTKEFTQLEKSAVKLTVTIEKKEVVDFYNSTVAKYVKNAQIPGFRKGHVPASVLERKYGDSLKADTLSELIDKSLGEIFELYFVSSAVADNKFSLKVSKLSFSKL